MIKTIAVTGSEGFIGSHLVAKLFESGNKVIRIDIKKGLNLLDNKILDEVPSFDLMIHLAAKTFVPDAFEKPFEFLDFNYKTTLNALELTRKRNAKFVFISSYLYGEPKYLPINEIHPLQPHNPYAYSKLIGEELCKCYYSSYQIPIIILRPFNLYGLGQNKNFLIPSIIKQIRTGKIELDDPRPKRDLLYINDFIKVLIKIIQYDFNEQEIYNIGIGSSISVEEIVNIITTMVNSNLKIVFKNIYRKNEIMDTSADISRIKQKLNWVPEMPFAKGIKTILEKSDI